VNPRQQGDFGEMSAAYWLASKGAIVLIPLGHSPDYDLVAELDGRLVRIEVKTCTRRTPYGRWAVMLCTRGGNQSWSGLTKEFHASRCDYVFVHAGDGRRWFLPARAIRGKTSISLGGSLYSEFEIESGDPIPSVSKLAA